MFGWLFNRKKKVLEAPQQEPVKKRNIKQVLRDAKRQRAQEADQPDYFLANQVILGNTDVEPAKPADCLDYY